MPGINKRESVVDTGFETQDERVTRIEGIFNDLRNEARSSPEAARLMAREAKLLISIAGEFDSDHGVK